MSQVTSQNALVKDSTVQTLNGKLDNLNATLGGNANIAPVFNTATAYSKDDMVNYNGDLYVFTANHSAGAWTGSDVVQTKVSSELSSLKSGLTNATTVSSGTITAQEGVTITRYILQKSIKTVFLFMLVKFTPTLGTGQLLCVLPSGYRAPDRLFFAGKNETSGKLVTCEVDSYGAVRVHPTSDDSTAVSTDYALTITYFTS